MGDDHRKEVPETGWRASLAQISPVFLRPPKSKAEPNQPARPMTDQEKRKAILTLDRRERQVGLIGAGLAALIALTTTLPYVLKPKTPVNETLSASKNHTCSVKNFHFDKANGHCTGKVVYSLDHWLFALAILLLFALAVFVTVRIGRRGPLGFTALMTGLAYETQVGILGLPFIAAGGWLLIRAWRVQRYGAPTATRANPSGERRAPPTRAERPTRAKKAWKANAPEKGPSASKRYTPKTQKRKRPTAPTPKGS
ncbi:MAG: hypothetical protein ACRDV6_04425 [Acidimicrobiales bacterium]